MVGNREVPNGVIERSCLEIDRSYTGHGLGSQEAIKGASLKETGRSPTQEITWLSNREILHLDDQRFDVGLDPGPTRCLAFEGPFLGD